MATLEQLKVRVGDVICVERYLHSKTGPRKITRIENGSYYADANPHEPLGRGCDEWVLIRRDERSLEEMIADVL